MAAKSVGIFVTGTMDSLFFVTGQIGMKSRQKHVNRCALLNLNRRIMKNFP